MPRSDAVDWLKAMGIGLIVYGHVAHASTVSWTPPIYVKQFGVAFFLFATGFTLARERRSAADALVSRLFPIYFFGLAAAALITTVGLVFDSGLALSNYLPFFGGANVLFDNFPANPTTWYLGTYVHFLVLWAVWLRHVRVRAPLVVAALLLEIPVRVLLITWAGPYVAYMLLTNWMAVFLLGLSWGARAATEPRGSALPYVGALVGGMAVWALALSQLGLRPTFPFMTPDGLASTSGLALVSAAISVLYASATLLAFGATRRLAAPAPVKFLARNSLIIFLAHMPVYMALNPVIAAFDMAYWSKVGVRLLVCLLLLGALSELIVRAVNPKRLGDRSLHALRAAHGKRRRGRSGSSLGEHPARQAS